MARRVFLDGWMCTASADHKIVGSLLVLLTVKLNIAGLRRRCPAVNSALAAVAQLTVNQHTGISARDDELFRCRWASVVVVTCGQQYCTRSLKQTTQTQKKCPNPFA